MNRFINTKNFIALCLTVISLILFTQCAEEFESPDPITGNTLVDVAATDTTLQIFSAALEKTGIGISLDNINSGQHTVFAPTDSAFRVYFQTTLGKPTSFNDDSVIVYINTKMSASSVITTAAFTARLQYHIISSSLPSADIVPSQVFTTINGARLSLSKTGSTVYINGNAGANGSKTRQLDVDGSNGVIHTVNKFMTAISTASAITNVLGITVDYSKAPPAVTVGATSGNNYDLLANAIKKTGLATVLRPNVPAVNLPDYTYFAPDDAAMQTYLTAISGGTVTNEATGITFINSLTDGDNTVDPVIPPSDPTLTEFTNVIKYHVATGRVLTTDLTLNQNVPTLLTGETFEVFALTPSVILEDATAAQATITGANTLTNAGIVHRLNAVLKPE